jgi:antitoxin component of RelBE/YafQ-DinJ toxin-antitoxin module
MPERDRVLTLRLSGAEHRRFKAVAEDMGLDVSAMLRALVREREKKEKGDDHRQRRSK